MIIKEFSELRTEPFGTVDPKILNLHKRVERALLESVASRDWWGVVKFGQALRDWKFPEPVCSLCNRFCYITSVDYTACPKTPGAIELLDPLGASPEEVFEENLYDDDF